MDLEHRPGNTLALIQSCDLVITLRVHIALCAVLCSSGFLSRQGLFGLIMCYTTHSADVFSLDNTGETSLLHRKAPFMLEVSCSLNDRLLDPAGKFIHHARSSQYFGRSSVWHDVHVARWLKDRPGSIPVSVKGAADKRCYHSHGGVKLISFSRATGDWQWDFITFWVPFCVLGRLCHAESQSKPEKTLQRATCLGNFSRVLLFALTV